MRASLSTEFGLSRSRDVSLNEANTTAKGLPPPSRIAVATEMAGRPVSRPV
jgi:hypothetical protein